METFYGPDGIIIQVPKSEGMDYLELLTYVHAKLTDFLSGDTKDILKVDKSFN